MSCPPSHVAVIGAGIIGSSIALNLTKKGCKVTILDASPHAGSAASGESWAWLNANRKAPEHYKEFNVRGVEVWRSLGALAQFPGTLVLGDTRSGSAAYSSDPLMPEHLALLEPCLSSEAAAQGGRLYRQEGFGYCAAASCSFVEEAVANGASVRLSESVSDVHTDQTGSGASRVAAISTESGTIEADTIVIAAGLGTPELAAKAGIEVPLGDKPATLNVYTVPAPPLLHHMLLSESLYLRQARDGSILISVYQDAETEKLHVPVDVASRPEETLRIGMQVRKWAAAVVPELANIGIDRVSLTRYPYPKDGHPIIGYAEKVPNVYIAVMHSGATLGPLVGQLAAAEITGTATAEELDLLKPYRLERDYDTSQQAYTVGGAQKV